MISSSGFPDRTTTLAAISKTRLYGILDTGYSDPAEWPRLAEELIAGGVGILQVRAKGFKDKELLQWTSPLITTCRASGIPLILNDHPHLARELRMDGCHLGQDDMPLAEARKILDASQVLGKSTHSLQQALDGEIEGADYIGFGPIFSTPTKPDYTPIGSKEIQEMYQRVSIPAFCIGGIKKGNIQSLTQQGAQRIVIVSGLLLAESPREYAEDVLAQM